MKILIADDNPTDRLLLAKIIENEGYKVVQACNGEEAVQLEKKHSPSIVFLDVLMPVMDGYLAAQKIKQNAGARFVPVIFLTSLTEASDLARCIDAGGDDFVSKPMNRLIIKAKIASFLRITELYDTVARQKNEIEFHREHLIQEQEVAKNIFDNIAHKGKLDASHIKYVLSPMSIFNGDILIAAEKPYGGMHFMLGDFTGHGLPAAIGAMPASEIFYGMTVKGFAIEEILIELNSRLHAILPRGVFCCVTMVDLDVVEGSVKIWGGGSPPSYLIRGEDGTVEEIPSKHLPVAILSSQQFKVELQVMPFQKNDRLYLMSDGIIECTDENGEMFGNDRLLKVFEENKQHKDLFERLLDEVEEFKGSIEQEDDISFLEISFPQIEHDKKRSQKPLVKDASGPIDGAFVFEFNTQSLRLFDPLPFILQSIMECTELAEHRGRIFTILSELYLNALDHGLLKLDSKLKHDAQGFARYYNLRAKRLAALEKGKIVVKIRHIPCDEGGKIEFEVSDDGDGFDFQKLMDRVPGNEQYSGRGIPLVRTLCEAFEYSDNGKKVSAIYRWRQND